MQLSKMKLKMLYKNYKCKIFQKNEKKKLSKNLNSPNIENINDRFNTQNLDFFYLNISKLYKIKYIIHNHKKTIFKEIYIFNKRIQNYIFFINKILMKNNLFLYFRESILN